MNRKERNRENSRRFRRRNEYRADFQLILLSKIGIEQEKVPVLEKPDKGSNAMNIYYQRLDNLIESYLNRYYNMRHEQVNPLISNHYKSFYRIKEK